MRVPIASVRVAALLALSGAAFGRTPAPQDDKKQDDKKAKATDASADQNAPAEAAPAASEIVVPADTVAWQTLSEELFTSAETSVADPGRLEPLARHIVKFGPIELLPKFDENLVYDDNVFLTEKQTERAWIARTGLGLLTDYTFGGGSHHLTAGYDQMRNYYLSGDAKNFVEQVASGQIDLGFQHLKITLGDRWEDRTDPILAVFTDKIERTINTPHGLVGWHADRWYADVSGQQVTTRYHDPVNAEFDRAEGLASLETGYLAREELWTFVRVDATSRSFDNPGLNDGRGAGIQFGARGKRGDEIDALVSVGVLSESFDDNFATDADDTAINAVGEARVRWWVTRSAAFDARLLRVSEFSPVSNYEIDNRAEVGWMQQIDTRLSARGGVGIEYINPSNSSDTFTRYTAGAGLRYALFANADLTLNWRTRIRSTSAPNGDYTENQYTLGFSIRLGDPSAAGRAEPGPTEVRDRRREEGGAGVRRPELRGLAVPSRRVLAASAIALCACTALPQPEGAAGGAPEAVVVSGEGSAPSTPTVPGSGVSPSASATGGRPLVEVLDLNGAQAAELEPKEDRLAVGDQIKIVVVGQVDLSNELPVPPSGQVELPVVGTIELLGRTAQELTRELSDRLIAASFLVDPEVSVTILRFAPRRVFVVEGVEHPEAYEIPTGGALHLTQAIALAGGLSPGADPSNVTILRRPKSGPPQRLRVDLRAILDSDRVDLDPLLRPDDAVLVRDVKQGEEQVFVTGKVRTPGAYRFSTREGISFLQAIILAGGLDKYAKPDGAALLRRTTSGRVTIPIDLKRILAGELDRDLPLQSGDVVFVPESFF
jgi:polysaccharide export outer membrane protein